MKTKYFGEVTFTEDQIFTFENGIFGFENNKKFAMMNFEDDTDAMVCLQSTEDEGLAFVLMNPFFLMPDYQPELRTQDIRSLEITQNTKGVLYYVVCVVRENMVESTVNLRCPVVINPETKKAVQVILENNSYSFKHPLYKFNRGV
ncbi:MAG: flagellar assembly protein FliW [Peptostreptococcaceae bacterium]|nr:flagellar assembly protein FliW [Peptostreptococcaceae bacterium]